MKYLLFDCPSLCWAAYYTTGQSLTNGVVYGFLRQMLGIQDMYPGFQSVFVFDHDTPKRNLIYPSYKESRRKDPEVRQTVGRQVLMLKEDVLPSVGFKNVFYKAGYEGDDIIASLVQSLRGSEMVIISRDHDLYQLLSLNVSVYHSVDKKLVTWESFSEEYQIEPAQWVDVKAIAGCSGDDIPGVPGVGEKTALKYLRGELNPGVVKDRIIAMQEQINFNYKLVRLPFPGCPKFNVQPDLLTKTAWRMTMTRLRMTSIQSSFPNGAV